jgi:hypothetical protein
MKLFVVLLAVAGLAFASGTFSGRPGGTGGYWLPETDDLLDSYAYSVAEQMSTIGASFDDYAVIDDFPMSAIITKYTCWGVTTGAAPTTLDLLVVADDGGVPTGAPLSQNSYPTSCGNSGFTYGGYTIWVAEMTIADEVVDNNWLGSHRTDGGNWYPVGGITITGAEGHRTTAAGWAWQSFTASGIPAGDLFKVIEGTLNSLERNTWAGIKNMF